MISKAATVLLLLASAGTAAAQSSDAAPVFSGQVASGSWLRIRNFKGSIRVTEASGSTATVSARRSYRARQDGDITFEVRRDGSNVTVCAITQRTRRCDANGYESSSGNDSNYGSADFTVALPRGVRLVASTGNGEVDVRNAGAEVRASSGNGEVNVNGAAGRVSASSGNGDIQVDGAGGDVEASSGNGDIHVSTSRGPVSAHSGNGRIDVRMASVTGGDDMEFDTGNGSITIAMPADISATIDANVSYNGFETDFPIQIPNGFGSGHVRGTIGSGARRIRLSTGNGRITLKKI
jgi:hypothetical protein